MTKTQCFAKHCKYQVSDKDWLCPKCGAGPEHRPMSNHIFVIMESADGANDDCDLMHDDDGIECDCGYVTIGCRFSQLVARKKQMVPCKHCKGTGMVKGGTP